MSGIGLVNGNICNRIVVEKLQVLRHLLRFPIRLGQGHVEESLGSNLLERPRRIHRRERERPRERRRLV